METETVHNTHTFVSLHVYYIPGNMIYYLFINLVCCFPVKVINKWINAVLQIVALLGSHDMTHR